jgi:translation initiation factor 2B subunit (eIF-2B alpha/beta/delta family)
MFNKKKRFEKICNDIKEIKIQGATNVTKAAIKAYFMFPSKSTKYKLLALRPTEPMLSHVLDLADQGQSKKQILSHFNEAQEQINKQTLKLIKPRSVIFTHCHSTNVIKALIYAKIKRRRFEVYNTETRPLFQGRKTSNELKKAKIKTTQFIDSAMLIALQKIQGTKKVSKIFLGADALLSDAVVNKVGSGAIAQLAKLNKIPVYIIADSWKHPTKNPSSIKLEQRDFKEIWPSKNIHIKNPAFESIPKKNITGIITEHGLMSYDQFLKKV